MRAACVLVAALAGSVAGGPPARGQQAQAQRPAVQAEARGPVEALVREGWEVTGYVAASDIRTLVLLRHKDNPWLVQCSVLIDVTRQPAAIIRCYELR